MYLSVLYSFFVYTLETSVGDRNLQEIKNLNRNMINKNNLIKSIENACNESVVNLNYAKIEYERLKTRLEMIKRDPKNTEYRGQQRQIKYQITYRKRCIEKLHASISEKMKQIENTKLSIVNDHNEQIIRLGILGKFKNK